MVISFLFSPNMFLNFLFWGWIGFRAYCEEWQTPNVS